MQLTMAGDYAVRSMLHLTLNRDKSPIALTDISEGQDIPKSFLYKIMQTLIKQGFVMSHKGSDGGYSLARDPGEITLREVIEAAEGPIYLNRCLIKPGVCDRDHYCSVHPVWGEVQKALMRTLESYTIEYLAKKMKENLAKSRR